MELAFIRWIAAKEAEEELTYGVKNNIERYEAKTILERYILSKANGRQDAMEKAEKEIIEKKGSFSLGVPNVIRRCLTILSREEAHIEEGEIILDVDEYNLSVSSEQSKYKLSVSLSNPRYQRLLQIDSDAYWLATLLLNYESLLPGGQQWGVPWPVARLLYDNGFSYEGFGSPLNSREIDFFPVEKLRNGLKVFGSLFEDDSPYGSFGNFFNVDLLSVDASWSINPPMIESLVLDLAKKVIQACSRSTEKHFFISISNWTDAKGYVLLKESIYLKEHYILRKGNYYYHKPDKKVVPVFTFDSAYFILGGEKSPPLEKNFIDALRQAWLPSSLTTLFQDYENTPLWIDKITADDRTFYVINDAEKYEAGSKERGIPIIVERARRLGNPVYAGSSNGYAQIAIAKAAYIAGRKAILFLQNQDNKYNTLTRRAKLFGAEIYLYQTTLEVVEKEAKQYVREYRNNSFIVEFGLNDREISSLITNTLQKEVEITDFPNPVRRIWLVSGSATLLKSLYSVFPHPDVKFEVVQVGRTIFPDLIEKDRTTIHISKYRFNQATEIRAPYASIPSYDEKVWEFVLREGRDGDYIWNVGKEDN